MCVLCRVAKPGLLLLLAVVLAAGVYRCAVPPLSAAERQVVGTWRHFNENGVAYLDERLHENRRVERRRRGDADFSSSPLRWYIRDDQLNFEQKDSSVDTVISKAYSVERWISKRLGVSTWVTGYFFDVRQRSRCRNGLKQISLALWNYHSTVLNVHGVENCSEPPMRFPLVSNRTSDSGYALRIDHDTPPIFSATEE